MGSKKKEVLLSIANSQRVCAHSYYVLCRYVCACAQTPIKETPIWFLESILCKKLLQFLQFYYLVLTILYYLVLRVNSLHSFYNSYKQSEQLVVVLLFWFYFTDKGRIIGHVNVTKTHNHILTIYLYDFYPMWDFVI